VVSWLGLERFLRRIFQLLRGVGPLAGSALTDVRDVDVFWFCDRARCRCR
jgi:hypothetical protein